MKCKRALTAIVMTLVLAAHGSAGDRPNIALVFIDAMGWGDFSCFGNQAMPPENGATFMNRGRGKRKPGN